MNLAVARKMPVQKPGRSRQDYGTPQELIDAVEARFGKLTFDLAASDHNAKADQYFTTDEDYLTQAPVLDNHLCWLNPPFDDLGTWMKKTLADTKAGQRTIELVPASVGSEWFAQYVWGNAYVLGLRPRLTFQGCKDPYPKDCILILWGGWVPGFDLWRWK